MLNRLPTEIQLALLESNPQLAYVSRGWYQLNNLLYRDLCLKQAPESYWKRLKNRLCEYVRSLDDERKAARLLNWEYAKAGDTEYLSDSWQILYCALFVSPKFFGTKCVRRETEDTIRTVTEYSCPMEIDSGREYQCSVWFRKKSEVNKFGAVKVVCSGEDGEQLLAHNVPPSIDDWCHPTGTYCFFAGTVVGTAARERRRGCRQAVQMQVSITSPTSVEMVAVDLRRYPRERPWLFFSTPEQDIFNSSERRLSVARMKMEEEGGNNVQSAVNEEGEEENTKTERGEFRFVYKYPRDRSAAYQVSRARLPYLGG